MVFGKAASTWGLGGRVAVVGLLAGAVAVAAPVFCATSALADSSPTSTPSPTASPTVTTDPSASPTPSEPVKPSPSASPTNPKPTTPGPSKPAAPAKKPKKKKDKKKPAVVDMAVVLAAAQRQLDGAKPNMARAQRALDAAKRTAEASKAKVASLRANVSITQAVSLGDPGQSAMQGLSTGLLPQVAAPSPNAPPLVTKAMLSAAERDSAAANQALADAQAAYDLVRLNIATAKATLGLASGALSTAKVAAQFQDYPVGDCSFPDVHNPSDCRAAQRWAIGQTVNPMKNWDHLCLNLVTLAYGWSSGAPTAIAMWNGLPERRKHSPNTVAPPGALMFWGPNHVAISLGNNVMVSTDVLGAGRAWIVSFETIQAAWGLQYLGWSEPDFGTG